MTGEACGGWDEVGAGEACEGQGDPFPPLRASHKAHLSPTHPVLTSLTCLLEN